MNYDILILAMAFINLTVGFALLYFVIKSSGTVKESSDEKYKHLNRCIDDLLERIQRIEKNYPDQAIAAPESYMPQNGHSGAIRAKSVMEKLRNGENPDQVRKDHGYSRSEMGLILAAAGLAGNNPSSI
ncbi:MAG: hypothetical protein JSW64_08465 [Candidatus Zixiibacteriota bacterium]|nr:MAG: hypothetical protein JSW64_08465 [candidate division Zixibacteria bacterium]